MNHFSRKSMFEEFTVEGFWSTDPEKKSSECSYGLLHYSPKQITLKTFGSLNGNDDTPYVMEDYDSAFGFSTTGETFKLSTVISTNQEFNFPGTLVEEYSVNHIFITNENSNIEENSNQLESFSLSMTFLNKWLPNTVLEKIEVNKKQVQTITINPPSESKISSFAYSHKLFTLNLCERYTTQNSDDHITVQWESYFVVNAPEDGCSIADAVAIANSLSKLLTIMFGQPISTKYLRGKLGPKKFVNILYSQNYSVNINEEIRKEKLQPKYQLIETQIPSLLENWFGMSEEMKILIDDYLSTITQFSTIENTLVNLTQGIDSFYRKGKEKPLLSRIRKLLSSPIISNDILNWAKVKSKLDDMDKFTNKIKNSRVFLTHGTDKKVRYDGIDLATATNVLQLYVKCFILIELGLPTESLKFLSNELSKILNVKYYSNKL